VTVFCDITGTNKNSLQKRYAENGHGSWFGALKNVSVHKFSPFSPVNRVLEALVCRPQITPLLRVISRFGFSTLVPKMHRTDYKILTTTSFFPTNTSGVHITTKRRDGKLSSKQIQDLELRWEC
jgi:hypothetical protein